MEIMKRIKFVENFDRYNQTLENIKKAKHV